MCYTRRDAREPGLIISSTDSHSLKSHPMYAFEMHLTNDEAHWLAGLLEGEGSFLHGPPSAPNSPRIALEMIDADVVERAANLLHVNYIYRGHRHPERGWKPSYRIALKGVDGVRMMLALRPLMGSLRQSQIDGALRDYAPRYARVGRSSNCISKDCGLPSYARDLCHKHYLKFIKQSGGKAPRLTVAALDPGAHWLNTSAGVRPGSLVFSKARAPFLLDRLPSLLGAGSQ